jgi:hypothetical protein
VFLILCSQPGLELLLFLLNRSRDTSQSILDRRLTEKMELSPIDVTNCVAAGSSPGT